MKRYRYSSVPVLKRSGEYVGSLTEGDLLWGMKDRWPDFPSAEKAPLAELPRGSRQHQAVLASTDFSEVMARALEQNYVPVVDDRGMCTASGASTTCGSVSISQKMRSAEAVALWMTSNCSARS